MQLPAMVADDTELRRHVLTILLNAVSPIRAEGRTELRYGAKNSQSIQRSAMVYFAARFSWHDHMSIEKSHVTTPLRVPGSCSAH
jgi:hypothetical protein